MDKQKLKELIEEVKKESFMPEYQAKVSDQEVLGIVLSKYFEWDGLKILEVASSGLEDANFHKEAALVDEMIEKYK